MMGFGMVGGMILFWAILIVLAVLVVRGLFRTNRSTVKSELLSARQILEQRYARGEINHEQFLLMIDDIK
ncbi:MAG: electron transporter RnfE [Anaerolinea sp.]|nr:electron transporter RnfE [Anaerolinea sp.]